MIQRRHWLGASAAGVNAAQASPLGKPELIDANTRPDGFELPQSAAFDWQGSKSEVRIESHVDGRPRQLLLSRAGQRTRRLGAGALDVQAPDFLNLLTAVAFNATSQTLWVACADARLHVFNPQGQWLGTAGNTHEVGDALGQCKSVGGMAVDAGGRVWVADPVLGLVHLFDARGEFVSRHALLRPSSAFSTAYWQPRGLRASGNGVQVWVTPDHSGGFAVCRDSQTAIA